jgi:two-component system response regulator HydG
MNTHARVLVVCDDEAVLHGHCVVLLSANFMVRGVRNGVAALDFLARQAVDVVLMEYGMPGRDGLELIRQMKSAWPDTQVVVISAAPSLEFAKQAMSLGACDFLIKPVLPFAIRQAAQRAVTQKKWALRRIPDPDAGQSTHRGESP